MKKLFALMVGLLMISLPLGSANAQELVNQASNRGHIDALHLVATCMEVSVTNGEVNIESFDKIVAGVVKTDANAATEHRVGVMSRSVDATRYHLRSVTHDGEATITADVWTKPEAGKQQIGSLSLTQVRVGDDDSEFYKGTITINDQENILLCKTIPRSYKPHERAAIAQRVKNAGNSGSDDDLVLQNAIATDFNRDVRARHYVIENCDHSERCRAHFNELSPANLASRMRHLNSDRIDRLDIPRQRFDAARDHLPIAHRGRLDTKAAMIFRDA